MLTEQAYMQSMHVTSFEKFRKMPTIHEAAAVVLEHIITENVEIKQALRTCRGTVSWLLFIVEITRHYGFFFLFICRKYYWINE